MSDYANDDSVGLKRRRALARLIRRMRNEGSLLSPPYSLVDVLEKRKNACRDQAETNANRG